ncbi:MAG TPA: class I SAM-dependent methyltransferase [Stellaceae bacterium]|nr:class I SAM-dependent methyltransferase [Stellaceae bacterium]
MKLESSFEGFVDAFTDGIATGWVLDRRDPEGAIDIDLFVDGEYAASVTADLPRPDLYVVSPVSQQKGFRLDVSPHIADRLLPRIDLYFGGSFERIPCSPVAALHINKAFINVRELSGAGLPRWIPTPPAELIIHTIGIDGSAAQLQREYLNSGLVASADVFNLLLDLGAPVRKPWFSLLDIGCGAGRYAPFLDQFIPNLDYLGVDIWKEGIDWAQQAMSAVRPNLRFALLEQNSGYAAERAYALPVTTGSADAAIAMSLFTHLDPAAVLAYFREVARVLASDGVAIATFFVLDEASRATAESAAAQIGFPIKKMAGYWYYGRGGYLDIYYEEAIIREIMQEAGPEPIELRRGTWYRPGTGGQIFGTHQDTFLLRVRAGS